LGLAVALELRQRLEDRGDDIGRRGRRQIQPDGRRLGHHRVVGAGSSGQVSEVGANQHDRLLRAVRITDLPARAGVGVGAVHDSDQAVGPVDPADVGGEDARRVLARFLLLGEEDLVAGGAQRGHHLGIPGALRRREQRSGEIQLHGASIAERRDRYGVYVIRIRWSVDRSSPMRKTRSLLPSLRLTAMAQCPVLSAVACWSGKKLMSRVILMPGGARPMTVTSLVETCSPSRGLSIVIPMIGAEATDDATGEAPATDPEPPEAGFAVSGDAPGLVRSA